MGKFGKLVTLTAVAAAAGAGAYYYLNKTQEAKNANGNGDGADTEAKSSESVTDFFKEKRDAIMNSREYVSLSKNLNETKNALVKTVTEAAEMIKEKAAEAKDGVGVVPEENKEKAEDFEFDSFEGKEETEEETAEEIAGEIRDEAQHLADELIDEYKEN